MILGNDESKIVKMAVSCQSEIADGVVQYNYETGELCGASLTTGEVESPELPLIEVFRLPQGERGENQIDCRCWEDDDCPFRVTGTEYDIAPYNPYSYFDEEMKVDGEIRKECCVRWYSEEDFLTDFESNWEESVKQQISDVIKKYLGEPKGTLATLNEIRQMIIDCTEPHKYLDAVQDNWYYDVLDSYVDNALENGFNITETDAIGYLDGEVEYLIGLTYNADTELMKTVRTLLEKRDIESAFDVLSS